MAELEWEGAPQRPMLRRATRHGLRRFDPTIRVVAEEFLAETSPIDLLAVGGEGEVISLRIGHRGDDVALLTHCLSDLAWLQPRLPDLLKLAPALGLEPTAAPRAMLLCPEFAPETRSAAGHLPRHTVELLTYRCLRERGQLSVLIDAAPASNAQGPVDGLRPAPPSRRDALESQSDGTTAHPEHPFEGASPADRSGFRTGLRDEDLRREALEEDEKLD